MTRPAPIVRPHALLLPILSALAAACTEPPRDATPGGAEPIPLAGAELFAAPPDRAFATWPPEGYGVPAVASPDELSASATATPAPPAEAPGKVAVRQAREALGRLDFEAAVDLLTAAIEADPGHIPSRYELARAHALAGRPTPATEALTGLAELAKTAPHARQLLDEARVEPAFKALRAAPAFRELTGATPVLLTWAPGDSAAETRAQTLAEALERNRWEVRLSATASSPGLAAPDPAAPPADAGSAEGAAAAAGDLVRIPRGDVVAARVARRVALLAGGLAVVEEAASTPGAGGPVIVIRLVGAGSEAATAGRPPPGAAPPDLGPWLGASLSAREDGTLHALTLRPTGFFTWRVAGPAGREEQRSGRHILEGQTLRLRYKAVVETPASDAASGPTTETRSGLELVVPVATEGDALVIGDLRFTRSETP